MILYTNSIEKYHSKICHLFIKLCISQFIPKRDRLDWIVWEPTNWNASLLAFYFSLLILYLSMTWDLWTNASIDSNPSEYFLNEGYLLGGVFGDRIKNYYYSSIESKS